MYVNKKNDNILQYSLIYTDLNTFVSFYTCKHKYFVSFCLKSMW